MSQRTIDSQLIPNPDYGSGCFRRRIRLSGFADRVEAELEDTNHGFRSTVYHDGLKVTDVRGETPRIPYNTCAGAVRPIRELIGTALDRELAEISRHVDPRANCTHLYDLTLWAIAHARRGEITRQYDVRVDDQLDDSDEPALACVCRDGEVIHEWQTRDWHIVGPAELRGKPLVKGFAAWASERFAGDEHEAAFVLHKGFFVSAARRYDLDRLAGTPAPNDSQMLGVCYSYSPGVVEGAVRLPNTIRDFSDTPEELLKFR